MTPASQAMPVTRIHSWSLSPRQLTIFLVLLILALAIRLIQISHPLVDQGSWLQADVALIAKSLYRHGLNIVYAEINCAGPAGYVGAEFPLVPLLAAGLYVIYSTRP
jgi:hypothetical protein